MAELFSPSAIGQPLALDPTLPMEPMPDAVEQPRGAARAPTLKNRLFRVGGELRANKEGINMVMNPYVTSEQKMDIDLEMYTAAICAAPDVDDMQLN